MKRRTVFGFLLAVVTTTLLVTSLASSASSQVHKWTLQPYLPEVDPSVSKNVDRLIAMIDEYTNGRVKITKHPAGSIVKGGEVLTATATGILDMSVSIGGYNAGALPAAVVEDGLPLQWVDKQQMTEVLWDYGLEELMREAYVKQGVHLLGLYSCGGTGAQILMAKPVRSLDELKGKKIRTWGTYLKLVKKLGASPVSMPLGEVYSALQMGALDGILVVTAVIPPFKLYEVAPYGLLPQLTWGATHSIFVNPRKWKALSDDLRTIVSLTFDKWKAWNARYYNPRHNYVTIEDLKALKMQFIELSDADRGRVWDAAMEIWKEVADKDPTAAKAIQIVENHLKETGRWEKR